MLMGGIVEKYPDRRRVAEYILLQGWLTLSEIADGLEVSRQLVRHWAAVSGVDYQAKRQAWLVRCFKNAKLVTKGRDVTWSTKPQRTRAKPRKSGARTS